MRWWWVRPLFALVFSVVDAIGLLAWPRGVVINPKPDDHDDPM